MCVCVCVCEFTEENKGVDERSMEALVGGCEDPAEWVTAPPTPATSPEPTTGPETSMAWAPWGLLREERKDSELSLVASSY